MDANKDTGNDFQTIEAAAFNAPSAGASHAAPTAQAPLARRLPVRTLALLVVVVLGVGFLNWLSERVPEAAGPVPIASTQPAAAGSATVPAAPSATAEAAPVGPFEEALVTRKRREAQDVLMDLLDVRSRLVEMDVERWAAAEFAAAIALATRADEAFKAQDYDAALAGYRESATALTGLLSSRDERRDLAFAAAQSALADGPLEAATAAVAAARALAPEDAELADLDRRLAALPQVLTEMRAAERALRLGQLEAARDAVAAAEQRNAGYKPLVALAGDINGRLRARNYLAAMSEGYAAMARGDQAQARKSFADAQRIDGSRDDAQQAMAQLSQQSTLATIGSLEQQGAAAMRDEQFDRAIAIYDQALAADSTLTFARRGRERSQVLQTLLGELQSTTATPERFSDDDAFAAATALYERAIAFDAVGPKLRAAIDALEAALDLAATPATITVRSDAATNVVLERTGELGQFAQRELQLRPGRYVFKGSRDGYRDVRHEVDVRAGMPPIDVRCEEPI